MNTRIPPAAWFFYVTAIVGALLGAVVLFVGIYGADIWTEPRSRSAMVVASLTGFPGIVDGVVLLIGAAMLAALGAVIHDIRRIVENTAPEVIAAKLAAALPRRTATASGVNARIVYYYFENEEQVGPVTHAQMAELLRTKRVSPFQRIEKSVNGVREDFNPREFAT